MEGGTPVDKHPEKGEQLLAIYTSVCGGKQHQHVAADSSKMSESEMGQSVKGDGNASPITSASQQITVDLIESEPRKLQGEKSDQYANEGEQPQNEVTEQHSHLSQVNEKEQGSLQSTEESNAAATSPLDDIQATHYNSPTENESQNIGGETLETIKIDAMPGENPHNKADESHSEIVKNGEAIQEESAAELAFAAPPLSNFQMTNETKDEQCVMELESPRELTNNETSKDGPGNTEGDALSLSELDYSHKADLNNPGVTPKYVEEEKKEAEIIQSLADVMPPNEENSEQPAMNSRNGGEQPQNAATEEHSDVSILSEKAIDLSMNEEASTAATAPLTSQTAAAAGVSSVEGAHQSTNLGALNIDAQNVGAQNNDGDESHSEIVENDEMSQGKSVVDPLSFPAAPSSTNGNMPDISKGGQRVEELESPREFVNNEASNGDLEDATGLSSSLSELDNQQKDNSSDTGTSTLGMSSQYEVEEKKEEDTTQSPADVMPACSTGETPSHTEDANPQIISGDKAESIHAASSDLLNGSLLVDDVQAAMNAPADETIFASQVVLPEEIDPTLTMSSTKASELNDGVPIASSSESRVEIQPANLPSPRGKVLLAKQAATATQQAGNDGQFCTTSRGSNEDAKNEQGPHKPLSTSLNQDPNGARAELADKTSGKRPRGKVLASNGGFNPQIDGASESLASEKTIENTAEDVTEAGQTASVGYPPKKPRGKVFPSLNEAIDEPSLVLGGSAYKKPDDDEPAPAAEPQSIDAAQNYTIPRKKQPSRTIALDEAEAVRKDEVPNKSLSVAASPGTAVLFDSAQYTFADASENPVEYDDSGNAIYLSMRHPRYKSIMYEEFQKLGSKASCSDAEANVVLQRFKDDGGSRFFKNKGVGCSKAFVEVNDTKVIESKCPVVYLPSIARYNTSHQLTNQIISDRTKA